MLPQTLHSEEKKTRSFLNDLGDIRNTHLSGFPWLFGTETATALDAHLMILLARLMDVGRAYLVPKTIRDYAEAVMAMDLWKDFMQGRTTMCSH